MGFIEEGFGIIPLPVLIIGLTLLLLFAVMRILAGKEEASVSDTGFGRVSSLRDEPPPFDIAAEARKLRDRGATARAALASILNSDEFEDDDYVELIRIFTIGVGFDAVEVLEALDREVEETRETIAYDAVMAGINEDIVAAFLDAGRAPIDEIESEMFDLDFDAEQRIRILYKILMRRNNQERVFVPPS